MRSLGLCLLVTATSCAAPADDADLGDFADAFGADGKTDGAAGQTLVLRDLDHAALPGTGRADAVVYVPAGYDPIAGPIDVVVFLHGHRNCAENVVRATNGRCRPGTAARQAHALAAQLEATGKRAILVVPQLAFDAVSSDPGALGEPGGFDALLMEIGERLEPTFGFPVTWWDYGDVVVVAHSGGYRTAARIASVGGYPVRELYLLDSFYDEAAAFQAWIEEDAGSFAPDAWWRRRFGSFYTGGSPQQYSVTLAAAVAPTASDLIDDRTTRTWSDADHARGVMFKRSGMGHDALVRWYFGRVVGASELPDAE